METIDLPPYAPVLMESTRSIGYSLEAAIADIVDNSITAEATMIEIDFFPIGDEYISILDNGIGMDSNEINNAMQYGSKNPNDIRDSNDLGRYGLGLKTASLSQCRKLTVISKKGEMISGRCWDLDHVFNAKGWSLLKLGIIDMKPMPDFEKLMHLSSGTLVIWQKLDRLRIGESDFSATLGLKMDIVRDHLALVFHRYLCGETGIKKVEININSKQIEYIDPFIKKKSTQIMDDEYINIRGENIVVKPYILPHISRLSNEEIKRLGGKDGLKRLQGFYVYRNKRLLVWGTWFRLMRQGDLSKLARVQVDIPNSLDDLWTLDIKKSTAAPPEAVRKNLANIINKIADGSKRTWTYRGKKEVDDSKIHFWNRINTRDEGIIYEINRDHPLVEKIIELYPSVKKDLYILLEQLEGNIPLNSLYIDLTNDEILKNDTEINEDKVINLLKGILAEYDDISLRTAMIENLKNTEPFCEYIDAIDIAIKGGEI